MRIAILDLGTNTFHLLISDVRNRKFIKVFKSKTVVKLGEGAIHKNNIAGIPFRRGIAALKHYREIIDEYKPDRIYAYATSAIRGARNGKEFVAAAKKEAGINVKVISGSREAELIYFGVRQCIKLKDEKSLIMDIGGGSTEFIIASDKKIFWKKSFKIGAARLLEIFRPSDPMTAEEIKKLEDFLELELKPLIKAVDKYPVTRLVGSSGSFDTFAEMIGYRFHKRNVIANVMAYKFHMDEFFKLHGVIIHSTLMQRMAMKGLIKIRVDMIVVSSVCTNYVLRKFGIKEMHLSKFALKEGALWEVINR